MGYDVRRFANATAGHLADGEHVLGGAWARTTGGFAAERAFGLAAGIAAQLGSDDRGPVRLPRSFEVAATERRLLFFDRSPMTGRPRRLVAEVPLDDVAVAEVTTRHRGIETVAIVLRRGGTISFEVAKMGARTIVERFVACVNEQLAGAWSVA